MSAIAPSAGKKASFGIRFKRSIPLYLMVLPGLVYLIINNYIPMFGIIIAFKNVNWRKGILASPWAGFSNFEYLFKTKDAWTITRNTLCYNLVFIVLGTVLAIAVAILLNEIRSKRLKQVYQTVFLLPYLICTPLGTGCAWLVGGLGCAASLEELLIHLTRKDYDPGHKALWQR